MTAGRGTGLHQIAIFVAKWPYMRERYRATLDEFNVLPHSTYFRLTERNVVEIE